MSEPRPKVYLVETQSIHRMFYAVRSTERPNGKAQQVIDLNLIPEIGQAWIGEKIVGIEEISQERFLKKFNEMNSEKETLSREDKLSLIINIDDAPPTMDQENGVEEFPQLVEKYD